MNFNSYSFALMFVGWQHLNCECAYKIGNASQNHMIAFYFGSEFDLEFSCT